MRLVAVSTNECCAQITLTGGPIKDPLTGLPDSVPDQQTVDQELFPALVFPNFTMHWKIGKIWRLISRGKGKPFYEEPCGTCGTRSCSCPVENVSALCVIQRTVRWSERIKRLSTIQPLPQCPTDDPCLVLKAARGA